MPYSDPLADGPTIQESSSHSLQQGMTIHRLFEQLAGMRETITLPVFLMGYLNPVMQYGLEAFIKKAAEVDVDGLILPDVPMDMYREVFEPLCAQHGLSFVFLITPETSEARIGEIDEASNGFIYMVSSSSTTGKTQGISAEQRAYFERIKAMNLKNPRMIGFGIADRAGYLEASKHADGVIIGSAFIRQLEKDASDKAIHSFIQSIKS